MKRLLFVFFICLFLNSNLPVINAGECFTSTIEYLRHSFQEIVAYARQYRLDPDLPPKLEEQRAKNILEEVYAKLPHHDSAQSLENAVHAFVTDVFETDFTVIDARQTDLSGKSHDAVFMVQDSNGELCYIVKAFLNPHDLTSKFLPEISALDLIKQLAMPNVVPVEPIAGACYSDGKQEWGLLLESVAKGWRIDQYVYNLAKPGSSPQERTLCLQAAEKAFQRMGQGLAELHRTKSAHTGSIPAISIAKYDDKLNQILADPFICEQLSQFVVLSDFVKYIKNIKDEALQVPLFYSYWHGDAHLGNMFYDEVADAFSFIDVAKMHQSIDIDGRPLLDGTQDLLRAEENLLRISLGLLTEEEVDRLLDVFYQAYESQAGQLLDKRLIVFYKTYLKLGRLISYSRYVGEQDPTKRLKDQRVFESALHYFEVKIKTKISCR